MNGHRPADDDAAIAGIRDLDTILTEPNRDRVALGDLSGMALDGNQTVVDGIAVERPGEALRNHGANARRKNDRQRDLHRRAAAEVAAGDKDVARSHRRRKLRIERLEQIPREHRLVEGNRACASR